MAKRKPKPKLPHEKALFHYAAEHEGRKLSVRIGGVLFHTVECGSFAAQNLFSGPQEVGGYWIQLANASGDFLRYEFNLAGRVLFRKQGRQLDQ